MIRRLSVFVGAAALIGWTLGNQDGIVLRRELKENAQDVYKLEIKGSQTIVSPAIGEQKIDMLSSMLYTMTTGKVDAEKGEAELEVKVSDMKFELKGPMADMAPPPDLPKEVVMKGKLDKLNRMTIDASQMANPQAMMMGANLSTGIGFGIEFPEKALKIGDSWEVALPKTPFLGNADIKLKATLLGEKAIEGQSPAFDVSLEGVIPLNIDLQEVMKAMPNNPAAAVGDMKILIKGSLEMKAKVLVEKATGRILRMETEVGGKQTMDMVDMGMTMDMTGTSNILMELQKG